MRAVILLTLLVSTPFLTAQTTTQSPSAEGLVHTRIEGIDIPSITAAPFTAKVVVTWSQPLVAGSTISRKYYTLVARDSQGRVRRETRAFIPAASDAEPPLHSFTITNPVDRSRMNCAMDAASCTVADFRAPLIPNEASINITNRKGFTRQSLGQQTLNSLPVVGTRETMVTNTGAGSNGRVLVSTNDLWYSPDLKMYLSVVRNNPQVGRVTLTVTDLTLGEPDPTMFGVPQGFNVVDARSNQSASQ